MGLRPSPGRRKAGSVKKDLWSPQEMEEEREDRPLQVFCCRAGNKTGELEMKNKKIAYPISRPLGFQGQSAFGY